MIVHLVILPIATPTASGTEYRAFSTREKACACVLKNAKADRRGWKAYNVEHGHRADITERACAFLGAIITELGVE